TAPEASVGSGNVTLVRPELSARATLPANDHVLLRMAVRLAESRYRFHGDAWGDASDLPLGLPPGLGDPDVAFGALDLHAAQLALESAYRLTEDTHWLAQHEQWAVVGSAYFGSRWEDSAFHSGLEAGAGIGIGYEIPERLRLALGISMRTPLRRADFDL